jgi:hypothetical protein
MRLFSLFPYIISLVPPLFLSENFLPQVLNMKVAGTLKYERRMRYYKADCVYEGQAVFKAINSRRMLSVQLDSFLHICCYISKF